MSEFRPSTIVAKLAEKLHGKPIAESIRSDGTVVIVFEDGRKLTFDKDAITRTLTEPDIVTPESAMPASLEGVALRDEGKIHVSEVINQHRRRRKQKE